MADYIKKARMHCETRGLDPATILQARLAPDMLDFVAQVQRVSDTAKFAVARLTGLESPKFDDNETTFDQLRDRIANTEAFIAGVLEDRFDGADSRQITLKFKEYQTTMDAVDYLLKFALPNFYFHVTTTHDILRVRRRLDPGRGRRVSACGDRQVHAQFVLKAVAHAHGIGFPADLDETEGLVQGDGRAVVGAHLQRDVTQAWLRACEGECGVDQCTANAAPRRIGLHVHAP